MFSICFSPIIACIMYLLSHCEFAGVAPMAKVAMFDVGKKGSNSFEIYVGQDYGQMYEVQRQVRQGLMQYTILHAFVRAIKTHFFTM